MRAALRVAALAERVPAVLTPPMTACRRSSPVSMYRLVNVSVNPAGTFGAPETEPGPSGWEDELMRTSFHRASRRLMLVRPPSLLVSSARRPRVSLGLLPGLLP